MIIDTVLMSSTRRDCPQNDVPIKQEYLFKLEILLSIKL